MHDTWYVLEDGNVVDPDHCAFDDCGILRHSSGVAVARRGTAYSSRCVAGASREVKAEAPARTYRTRAARNG